MNRGVISFTKNEVIYLAQLLRESDNFDIFKSKLNNAISTNESEISLQTNEDDLEYILDQLPTPEKNKISEMNDLRRKVGNALIKFRS